MAAEFSPKLDRRFVRDGLPWMVGAGALLVYLVSLNHWVTLTSLGSVIRVNGWNWPPALTQPVLFLLTYPFHWLPAAWVPLALNAFTAVCASLTLALLARSVALLPHDRLEQQRLLVGNEHALLSGRDAWVPVVLATCALGLQLTFWEHAIAASGEMLDLLLLAYCIRCLLEHRVDQRDSWLNQAALLYGIAMANNWAMVGFLPLFVIAVLRTKQLRFFSLRYLRRLEQVEWETIGPVLRLDVRFGVRMALLGLAGLSLFLLLPLAQSFSPDSPLTFWEALQSVAGSYVRSLHLTGRIFLNRSGVGLLLAAVSLLPVLLLSIRWGAVTGSGSQERFDLASFILHLAHAFLLLTCLWALFDPSFSPRQIGIPSGLVLPLYYLAALSIGYYSGFFLLLFGAEALQRLNRRLVVRRALCLTTPPLVYVLAALALAGLLLKNVPVIRAGAAPHLERYARLLAGSLPPEGVVVLSDDAAKLALVEAALATEGKAGRYLPMSPRALPHAKYRAWLKRKYPERWPQLNEEAMLATPGTNALLIADTVFQVVSALAESNRVFCLQASPGFLFERFYLQPHGLANELKLSPTNSLSTAPLPAAELADNQAFWRRAIEEDIQPVLRLSARPELPRPQFAQRLMQRAHLSTPPPGQSKVLALWYSSALNNWGATLQRNGLWAEAGPCFALSAQLNADNLPARLNLLCNSNRLAHQKITILRDLPLREQFDKYRDLNQLLAETGPLEEPSYCLLLAREFAKGGLVRQAAQQLERVNALAPDELIPRMLLGDLCARARMADQALQIIAEIRSNAAFQPLGSTNEMDLAFMEAQAWYAKTNRAKAEGIIDSLVAAHPGDAGVSDRAVAILTAHQGYTNALHLVRRQLQLTPDNVACLIQEGGLCARMGDFSNAIPPLTRASSLTNNLTPRLMLGELFNVCSMPDKALRIAAEIRAKPEFQPLDQTNEVRIAVLETGAWYAKTNRPKAEGIIDSLVAAHPGDAGVLEWAVATLTAHQGYTNALHVVRRQLQLTPDNVACLIHEGRLCTLMGDYSNAIPPLTRALSLMTNSYEGRMYRAEACLQAGQWDAAAADYKEALRVFPAAYQPYQGLANVALRKGDTNAANQYYQQSLAGALRLTDQQLQRAPDNPQALLDKGRLLLQAGQFSNAIPVFTRILSLTNSYEGRMYRAEACLQAGQWDAAAADYKEVLRAFPAAYEPYQGLANVALRRGDTNAANQYYQQGLAGALRLTDQQLQRAPDNPQALLDKGRLLLQAGQFSNAIPVFTRILSLTNSYEGRMYRAEAFLQAGQWDAAAADYKEALRAFPAASEPYQRLINVALQRGDTNAANQYYQQSLAGALRLTDQQLQRAPDNPQALLDKGRLLLQAGQFSNAIPVFTRILSLTNSYEGRMSRAQACLQAGQWDAAAADYKEALRAFPAASEPYQGLINVALQRGDTNTANQYYRQGISNALRITDQQLQLAPDNIQALFNKGVLYLKAEEFSNAIPVFTHILSRTNIYGGRVNRARAYVETRQWDAAEADYREALRVLPMSYNPYQGLAEVALRRGDTNAAIQHYEQYLSKSPTNTAEARLVAERLKSLQPGRP